MNTTKQEKTIKELFVGKCWQYLNDNFHKFSETNKIKIALALTQKNIPQEITGRSDNLNIVIVRPEEKKDDGIQIGTPTIARQISL